MPEFPVSEPLTIEASLGAGELRLTAEERTSAHVEVQPYDDTPASRELAERTTVEFTEGLLRVTCPDPVGRLFRRSGAVRVRINAPTGSSAQIKTASADTNCQGRFAHIELNTASGEARIDSVDGSATVRMASGDVRIARVGGQLRVQGASGDCTAGQVGGPAEVALASGDVRINEIGGDLLARTASGDVTVGTASRGRVKVTTASGDVSIGVRPGIGVWLDLSTVSGRARSDLGLAADASAGDQGTLSLQVRTVSGNIDVLRVKPSAAAHPMPAGPADVARR